MKAPETYEGRWGRCRKCGASVLIAASYSTTVACPECNKQFPVEYQGELDLKSIVPCDHCGARRKVAVFKKHFADTTAKAEAEAKAAKERKERQEAEDKCIEEVADIFDVSKDMIVAASQSRTLANCELERPPVRATRVHAHPIPTPPMERPSYRYERGNPDPPPPPGGICARQWVGLGGAAVLVMGVFAPLMTVPIVGPLNYFQNGKGDGVIVLVLAGLAVVGAMNRVYFLPFISGMGTLAMMVYTYMNITRGIAEMKSQMNRELAGNPFRGIADAAMQSVQMQWGWAVLLIGAFLLLICSGMRSEERVQ